MLKEVITFFKTGCETEVPLNLWVYGSSFIIRILIPSNSMELKIWLDQSAFRLIQNEQLVILSNLESMNAVLIQQELKQPERLVQLNTIAINQMKSLAQNRTLKKLK